MTSQWERRAPPSTVGFEPTVWPNMPSPPLDLLDQRLRGAVPGIRGGRMQN